MLKSTQLKIVLIFFIVGILIISALGFCFMNSINLINPEAIENEGVENIVNAIQQNTMMVLIVATVVFTLISIIIAVLSSALFK